MPPSSQAVRSRQPAPKAGSQDEEEGGGGGDPKVYQVPAAFRNKRPREDGEEGRQTLQAMHEQMAGQMQMWPGQMQQFSQTPESAMERMMQMQPMMMGGGAASGSGAMPCGGMASGAGAAPFSMSGASSSHQHAMQQMMQMQQMAQLQALHAQEQMTVQQQFPPPHTLTPAKGKGGEPAGQDGKGGEKGAGDKRWTGVVKKYNESGGFGFIECPPARDYYGVDVYIHRNQMHGLNIGDWVCFSIARNASGQPQARQVYLEEDEERFRNKKAKQQQAQEEQLRQKMPQPKPVVVSGTLMSEEQAKRFQANLRAR